IHSPAEGIDVYMLGVDTHRTMMPMLLVFEPGAKLAEYGRHPGEEFIHVMAGTLELTLMGSEPRILEAGDSAYYPGDRSHLFTNASDDSVLRVICVDSPPNLGAAGFPISSLPPRRNVHELRHHRDRCRRDRRFDRLASVGRQFAIGAA